MSKKLQVFVSSTFVDLRAERQAAVEAILEAGHIPAGMELFTAGDESQMEIIREWIDESDAFLLIVGGRYGSLEPKTEKSYTHLEWEYAGRKKKPRMTFVANPVHIEAKVKVIGPDAIEKLHGVKLEGFKKEVTAARMCAFFDDLTTLKLAVIKALHRLEKDEDLVGWVRANQAVNLKETLENLTRLQTENAILRRENGDLQKLVDEQSEPWDQAVLASKITSAAKSMIMEAAAGDGSILSQGNTFNVGGKLVMKKEDYTPRRQAELLAVLGELQATRLVDATRDLGYLRAKLNIFGFWMADFLLEQAKADGVGSSHSTKE